MYIFMVLEKQDIGKLLGARGVRLPSSLLSRNSIFKSGVSSWCETECGDYFMID